MHELRWMVLAASLVACGGETTSPDASVPSSDAGADAAMPLEWSFETIETRTLPVAGMDRAVELIRARRPDGASSYLLYVPAASAGAPLVVMTQPYAGIRWTGEDVDARWAATGAGIHPDVDAPAYDGDDLIAYDEQTVEQAAEAGVAWLIDGFAVVHAYGRFYAGGTLEDDMLDSAAPYHFALSRGASGELDLARIGAYGGSWGGMMALFGAARAPAGATPIAIVALAPPSDLEALWVHTDALPSVFPRPAEATSFFSPYRRRIGAATGGAPGVGDFTRYAVETLCDGLSGRALVPHDEWDVLVPFAQTSTLEATCPDRIEPLIWHRTGSIDYEAVGLDHGPFGHEPVFASWSTFAITWLGLSLADADARVVTAGATAGLAAFLETLRAEQLAGGDPREALPRLRELASPRVQALDVSAGAFVPGADLLADAVNTVYGTTHDATSLRAALEVGLPAP